MQACRPALGVSPPGVPGAVEQDLGMGVEGVVICVGTVTDGGTKPVGTPCDGTRADSTGGVDPPHEEDDVKLLPGPVTGLLW